MVRGTRAAGKGCVETAGEGGGNGRGEGRIASGAAEERGGGSGVESRALLWLQLVVLVVRMVCRSCPR